MNSKRNGQMAMWTCGAVLMVSAMAWAANVGKTFTYQGQLTQDGIPVDDECDFIFSLWDTDNGGNQIGADLPINLVNVENGRFSVPLDFGDAFTGQARWLQISVDCPAENDNFVPLNPRQELTPTPYAIGLSLPFSGQVADDGNVIDIVNSGQGRAASFQNSDGTNTEAALTAVTHGSGPAGEFINNGNGHAVSASSSAGATAINATSSGFAIQGTHTGNGMESGLLGETTSGADFARAIHGRVPAAAGGYQSSAVFGENKSQDPESIGVWGTVDVSGYGVYGTAPSDTSFGVYGKSGQGIGVRGEHISISGITPGVSGVTKSNDEGAAGMWGSSTAITADPTYGVRGDTNSSSGAGVLGEGPTGVLGQGTADAGGTGGPGGGPDGGNGGGIGVHGIGLTGVRGDSAEVSGIGMYGFADGLAGIGVRGEASAGGQYGMEALNNNGVALHAEGTDAGIVANGLNGPGISAESDSPQHAAGYFRNTFGGPALHADGIAKVSVLEITGADLAERFPFSEPVEPGMVVAIDPDNPGHLRMSREAHDKRVVGIVTGANDFSVGIVLGNLPGSENHEAVALNGRVWVYCDASEQAVEVGDLLTTAARPGYAMPVADASRAQGTTIGKAMTALPKGESGMVLVFVNLQ